MQHPEETSSEEKLEGENGNNPKLQRNIGLVDGVSVIVGIIIGTGIFASPGVIVSHVNQLGVSLLVWIGGGILSMLGGLCFAELGASLPATGGDYVYLKELHPVFAFLYLWAALFCVKTGSLAIIAIIFARYFESVFFNIDVNQENIDTMASTRLVALCAILIITVVNVFSVKLIAFLQKIFFMGKFLAAGMVILMSLYSVTFGDTRVIAKDNFHLLFALPDDWHWSFGYISQYFAQFGIATIAALWAYDGFTNLNHVAEEIIQPQKNIPRSIIIGVLIVVVTYLFVNVAYILVLTKEEIIASQTIAVTIAKRVWGNTAAKIIALLVSVSAFGTMSGSLFTGSRVFYAGAKDSLMPFSGFFSLVSVWFETPYTAIILSSIVASAVLMVGDFANLINYFGFTAWIFYGLCAVALIYVRQKKKHIVQPFRVRPYPVIPVLFILSAIAVIVSAFIQSPAFTIIAFSLLIFAVPFYFVFCWQDGRLFGNIKQQVLRVCCKRSIENPDLEGKEVPFEYPLDDFTPGLTSDFNTTETNNNRDPLEIVEDGLQPPLADKYDF